MAWQGFDKVWHDLTRFWHGFDKVWHDLTRFWHGFDKVWHGLIRFWQGFHKVWYGLTRFWHGFDKVWCGLTRFWHGFQDISFIPYTIIRTPAACANHLSTCCAACVFRWPYMGVTNHLNNKRLDVKEARCWISVTACSFTVHTKEKIRQSDILLEAKGKHRYFIILSKLPIIRAFNAWILLNLFNVVREI